MPADHAGVPTESELYHSATSADRWAAIWYIASVYGLVCAVISAVLTLVGCAVALALLLTVDDGTCAAKWYVLYLSLTKLLLSVLDASTSGAALCRPLTFRGKHRSYLLVCCVVTSLLCLLLSLSTMVVAVVGLVTDFESCKWLIASFLVAFALTFETTQELIVWIVALYFSIKQRDIILDGKGWLSSRLPMNLVANAVKSRMEAPGGEQPMPLMQAVDPGQA